MHEIPRCVSARTAPHHPTLRSYFQGSLWRTELRALIAHANREGRVQSRLLGIQVQRDRCRKQSLHSRNCLCSYNPQNVKEHQRTTGTCGNQHNISRCVTITENCAAPRPAQCLRTPKPNLYLWWPHPTSSLPNEQRNSAVRLATWRS